MNQFTFIVRSFTIVKGIAIIKDSIIIVFINKLLIIHIHIMVAISTMIANYTMDFIILITITDIKQIVIATFITMVENFHIVIHKATLLKVPLDNYFVENLIFYLLTS